MRVAEGDGKVCQSTNEAVVWETHECNIKICSRERRGGEKLLNDIKRDDGGELPKGLLYSRSCKKK